jgi:hypothetical protein
MMKKFFCILLVAVALSGISRADNDKYNVLSYYAVNNSLDGQLIIENINVLRFYPVFAMRDSVDRVNVTIYYGGNIFERDAERMDDGKYWQVLLPIFRLGEAIQRMEVTTHFRLNESYGRRFHYYKTESDKNKVLFKILTKEQEQVTAKYKELFQGASRNRLEQKQLALKQSSELDSTLKSLGLNDVQIRVLRKALENGINVYSSTRDSLFGVNPSLKNLETDLDIKNRIDTLIAKKLDLLQQYVINYQEFKIQREKYLGSTYGEEVSKLTLDSLNENQQRLDVYLDSLKQEIAREIEVGLTDTMYTGPSVRKSDIIIDSNFAGAHILYRNYKKELRYMPALDPAERMGIFRVRYVPFPITQIAGENKSRLHGPFGGNFTVFEVGMAFGDAIVPGDEFVMPEFSFKRLGVAFAITEKLFSDSAQVLALALTYDFNSYGSLGVGGNFAQHEVNPYFSFGINKKAFEAVLSGLGKLFK